MPWPTGASVESIEQPWKPDDYAGMIAFLLSDDAEYITGQTISVSGGLTMV